MQVEEMEEERKSVYDEVEEGDCIFVTRLYEEEGGEWIASTLTHSQKLAAEVQKMKVKKSLEEMVPAQYLEQFWEVFEKGGFDRLPEWQQWNHAIELKPGAEPFAGKIL